MRTWSPRASAWSATTVAEVAAPAGDEDGARRQRRSPRARGTSGCSPACPRPAPTVGLVAELRAGPGDVARDRVAAARRARAPAGRSDPGPGATRSTRAATDAGERAARAAGAAGHGEPLGLERVADAVEDRPQLVGLGVGDPVRPARRRRRPTSASSSPSTRLPVYDHRPLLRAVADEREPAAADRGEELRLARRLVRAVEPRRPHDDGREVAAVVAALHELLGLELRPPVRHVRVERRVLVKRSVGRALAPNGEFDDTCTKRAAPARRARSSTSWVPPTLTSKNSRTWPCGWITPAAWNTVASATPSNRRSTAARVAHVADDDLDLGADHLEQRRRRPVSARGSARARAIRRARARGSARASRMRR